MADVRRPRRADDAAVDLLVSFDEVDPPQGHVRVVDPTGPGSPFVGWLGLLAALEGALGDDPPGRRTDRRG
jgi:hypothetical protein